jgi:hypothetical protein
MRNAGEFALPVAIVVAGALVAAAIYFQPQKRYEAFEATGAFIRLDTQTGAEIACSAGGCFNVALPGMQADHFGDIGQPVTDAQVKNDSYRGLNRPGLKP